MKYYTLLLLLLLSLAAQAQIDTCDEQIHAVSDTPCTKRVLHLAVDSLPNTTYTWEGPGGFTASGDSVTRTPVSAIHLGNYIVTGTRGICTYKDTVFVFVKISPDAPFITSNSPLCVGDTLHVNATTTGMDFQFYFFGPPSPQNQQGYFEFAPTGNIAIPDMQKIMSGQYGSYQVGTNGCYSDTTYFNVQVDSCALGVSNINNDQPFIPNLLQSSDPVFKPIFKSNSPYKMQVFDINGRKVFESNNGEGWDRSAYNGIYFYTITTKIQGYSKVYKGKLTLL